LVFAFLKVEVASDKVAKWQVGIFFNAGSRIRKGFFEILLFQIR